MGLSDRNSSVQKAVLVSLSSVGSFNQPMTEKSASKRMVTQCVYGPMVPQQVICELVGGGVAERYPDFVTIAKGYRWGAATISEKADLVPAIEEMINSDGPYLLNVQVPYVEHVLPMIPAGATYKDIIYEGRKTLQAGDGL